MCKTQVRVWHKRFLRGEENIHDAPRSGHPRCSRTPDNIELIQRIIQEDGHLSLTDMCDCTGLSRFTVMTILKKDLKMKKTAKFIPHLLTQAQKDIWKRVCQENINRLCQSTNLEEWIHSVITGDETWLSTCEPDLKRNNCVWTKQGEGQPKTPRPSRFGHKTMLTLFCDAKGPILIEFMEPGTTIDTPAYIKTLQNLKECVRRKWPELWAGRKFVLHHDNASPHTAADTITALTKWNIQTLSHLPYSPDCTPCDFSFFPKLKEKLRGHRFQNIKQLQKEAQKILLSMDKSVFLDSMHDLVLRWQKCMKVNGDYFEGDNVQIDPLFEMVSGEDSDSDTDSEEED